MRLPNHVSEDMKRARSEQIQDIGKDGKQRFVSRFVNQTMPVLWEAVSGATDAGYVNGGYTGNYIRVQCIVPQVLTNQIGAAVCDGTRRLDAFAVVADGGLVVGHDQDQRQTSNDEGLLYARPRMLRIPPARRPARTTIKRRRFPL